MGFSFPSPGGIFQEEASSEGSKLQNSFLNFQSFWNEHFLSLLNDVFPFMSVDIYALAESLVVDA